MQPRARATYLVHPTPQAFAKRAAEFDDRLILAIFANSYRVLSFYILLSTQGAALGYELANAFGVVRPMSSSSFDAV